MRLLSSLPQALLLLSSIYSCATAASSWTFTDGSLTVSSKSTGSSKDGGVKEKLNPSQKLSSPISLGGSDTLKITLTAQESKTAKRPHQAFLLLQDEAGRLDVSFPFSVKESGKAVVSLTQKDIPYALLHKNNTLTSSIVIASFGSSSGYSSTAFSLRPTISSSDSLPPVEDSVRYGKLPEIHHVFRADPKSPPRIISLVFLIGVLVTFSLLAAAWVALDVNLDGFSAAFNSSPLSHATFLGSIFGIEAVFFMYYTSWNLFQTLPCLGVLGVVAFLSGSRALTEVQERRLAGKR